MLNFVILLILIVSLITISCSSNNVFEVQKYDPTITNIDSKKHIEPVDSGNKEIDQAKQTVSNFCMLISEKKYEDVNKYYSKNNNSRLENIFLEFNLIEIQLSPPPQETNAIFFLNGEKYIQFLVNLHVKQKMMSAWNDGKNTRFFLLVFEDGAWKIAQISSSP